MNHNKNEYGQQVVSVGMALSDAWLRNTYPDTILLMRILYRDSSPGVLFTKLLILSNVPLPHRQPLIDFVRKQ